MNLPDEALPLLRALAPAFTRPTLRILRDAPRRRRPDHGAAYLRHPPRTAAPLTRGHAASHRRIHTSTSWSAMPPSRGPCRLVLTLAPTDRPLDWDAGRSDGGREPDSPPLAREVAHQPGTRPPFSSSTPDNRMGPEPASKGGGTTVSTATWTSQGMAGAGLVVHPARSYSAGDL
jgi:hypothetical protein